MFAYQQTKNRNITPLARTGCRCHSALHLSGLCDLCGESLRFNCDRKRSRGRNALGGLMPCRSRTSMRATAGEASWAVIRPQEVGKLTRANSEHLVLTRAIRSLVESLMKKKPTPATQPGPDFSKDSQARSAQEPKAPGYWNNWDHYIVEPGPERERRSPPNPQNQQRHPRQSDAQASNDQQQVSRCGTNNCRRTRMQTVSTKAPPPESPQATNRDARTHARFAAGSRASKFERMTS